MPFLGISGTRIDGNTTTKGESLDFPFAVQKNLKDIVSGSSLITFTRASTATFVGSDGLIQTAAVNAPRFDHNPTTSESLGLLVEEARTNLLVRSEEIDNIAWLPSQVPTPSANTTTAPDNTVTAETISVGASGNNREVGQAFTSIAGTTYSFSFFVKAGTTSWCYLTFSDRAAHSNGWYFDVTNGAVGGVTGLGVGTNVTRVSSRILPAANGFWRCQVTLTVANAATYYATVGVVAGNNSVSATAGNTIFVWGAQLEVGAFPTSYIPTTTTTAARSADLASITGTNFSSWYNPTEGTMFADAKRDFAVPSGPFPRVWQIQGALNSSRIELSFFNGGQASFIATSGVTQFDWYPMYFIQNGLKSAQALSTNNVAAATNGEVTATDTSVTLPTVQEMRIGGDGGSSNIFNGTIRRLAYYPRRLSNTELQMITS